MKKVLSILCALSLAIGSVSAKTIYCKMEHSWWTQSSAAVGAYAWTDGGSSNANWPGVRMTPVEGMTNTWSIDIDESAYKKIIFTRVYGSGTIADWGAKTDDLTIPTDGQNFYTITDSTAAWNNDNQKCSGEWSTLVIAKYAVTFGVIGETGSLTATVKGSAIASGDEVADQSEVVFTASPADGYEVAGWYSDEQGENAIAEAGTALTYTATVGAATAVYVKFAAITTKEVAFLNTNGWESVSCTPAGGTAAEFSASEDVVWVNNGENLSACVVWKGELPLTASEVAFSNGTETLNTTIGEGMFNAQAQEWGAPFAVAYGNYITVTNVAEDVVFPSGAHVWSDTEVVFAAAREGAESFDGWFSDAACETAIEGATETAYTATITADTEVYAKFTMASLKVYFIDGRNWNSTLKMVTWANANASATAEYGMTKLSNNIFVAGAKYSNLYCAEYTTTEHDMCTFKG
ncbi:MAG: InlB B-repeat-containing protein, partial [Paludibacteraceae bacterium]